MNESKNGEKCSSNIVKIVYALLSGLKYSNSIQGLMDLFHTILTLRLRSWENPTFESQNRHFKPTLDKGNVLYPCCLQFSLIFWLLATTEQWILSLEFLGMQQLTAEFWQNSSSANV